MIAQPVKRVASGAVRPSASRALVPCPSTVPPKVIPVTECLETIAYNEICVNSNRYVFGTASSHGDVKAHQC